MARAFHFQTAEIGSISSRKDRSLAFRVITGEIPPEHMAEFFPLTGSNVTLLITPHEQDEGDDPVEVASEAEEKTPSQRLRASLWVWWDQLGRKQPFSQFYSDQIERIITKIKSKLD